MRRRAALISAGIAAGLAAGMVGGVVAQRRHGHGTEPLGDLPPESGWSPVDDVPTAEIEALAERGLALARENAGPLGPPASLLDQPVLTVSAPAGPTVKVPLRCLFALSGMGFLGGDRADGADDGGSVRVSATGAWLRLDARYGAVVRRRFDGRRVEREDDGEDGAAIGGVEVREKGGLVECLIGIR